MWTGKDCPCACGLQREVPWLLESHLFKHNDFVQDPKMSVCGNQHMVNQGGCEQAIEGLHRCLRKRERLCPPARLLGFL